MTATRKCPNATVRCRPNRRCQKCRADKAEAGRRYRERVKNGLSPEREPIELRGGSWVYTNGIAHFVPNTPHPLCGTDSGYYHHKRTKRDEPCRPCLDAHSLVNRTRLAGKVS